jgi:hypothetical protein
MKTLIIFNEIEKVSFLIIEGDYSIFNGVKVNGSYGNGFEDEFCEFMYDDEGDCRHELSTDISLIENKQWDKVALCTYYY